MFDNTFQEKSWIIRHFEIDHNDQLLEKSSIGNLILTYGMYLNQMVPFMEDFVHKRTCCHKLYAKKEKNDNFEKMHFAPYLQYPK